MMVSYPKVTYSRKKMAYKFAYVIFFVYLCNRICKDYKIWHITSMTNWNGR